MATYADLALEPWWGAEFIPPNLRALVERLQKHYGLGWTHIGCRGDNSHLRGYHRSRAWILNSRYCTDRVYSVSRTPGDRSGGDDNWLCAIDMTIPRDKLLAACSRLDAAVRAGKLEKLTEWYGNTNGDSRVDGYDNIANAVASSDDSHLWHLHMSFDRGRADEDHSDLYEILTGDDMQLSDKLPSGWTVGGALDTLLVRTNYLANTLNLAARLDAILAAAQDDTDVTVQLDDAARAELAAIRAELAAVPAEVRDAVADLAEGGAAAVRADG